MVYFFFRGGKYSEDDAKAVMVQILNVVAFCHLQGVVHRDLKPEVSMWLKPLNLLYFQTNLTLARHGNGKWGMGDYLFVTKFYTPSPKKPLSFLCHR